MPNAVRVASGLAIAVGVCACSTPPRTGAVPGAPPPIEARILPPFQGLVVFDVNQPAYVAVFDVRPYIGVEMIYPGPNDPGRATGGVQAVTIFPLVQADAERRAQATPFFGGGEDYLYLLASRTPLDLGEFANHPILLSDSAGVSLRALPPYEQIDSLMRNVVRPLYDNDWDADVLILAPGPDPSVNAAQLALDCGIPTAVSSKICAHEGGRIVPTVGGAPDAQALLSGQGVTPHRTAAEDWADGDRGSENGRAVSRSSVKSGSTMTTENQAEAAAPAHLSGGAMTARATAATTGTATASTTGAVGRP